MCAEQSLKNPKAKFSYVNASYESNKHSLMVEFHYSLVNGKVCWVPLSLSKSKWVLIDLHFTKNMYLNLEYISKFLMNRYKVSTRIMSLFCSCLKLSLLDGLSIH
jgi:hypothetical protein